VPGLVNPDDGLLERRFGGDVRQPPGVPASPPPRVEGTVPLPDGRRLGYAEYGDPDGPLVMWFHGTPGARRQVPPSGRRAADELGLRVVCVERPGVGDSTDHAYRQILDWADDVTVVAEHLGRERFLVVGLSGGGPYTLACAHALPEQVVAVAILGGLVPTSGGDAAAGGVVALSRPFNRLLTVLRRPLGRGLWGFIRVTKPAAHPLYRAYARFSPEGDQKVFDDPATEAMFINDLTFAARRQFQAFVNDLVLVGRPWGFRLADVRVPVRWWHGDADPFVGLDQAQRATALLPDVELIVRHGESHLGGFAAADEILTVLAKLWEERNGTAPRR
jgi:pimeloyl-ACP methyl ester carboxylesterase